MANVQELSLGKILKWLVVKVADLVVGFVIGKLLSEFGSPFQGILFLRLGIVLVVTCLCFLLIIAIGKRLPQHRSNAVFVCLAVWLSFTFFFLIINVGPCTPTSVNVTKLTVLKSEDVHEVVKNLVWMSEGGEETLAVTTAEAVYIYQPRFVLILLDQLWIDKREFFRGRTNGLAADPQRQYLAYGVGTLIVIKDIKKGDTVLTLEHQGDVTSLDYSPQGEWLASASEDGTIKTWRRIGRIVDTFKSKAGGVTVLKYQPVLDGKLAYGTVNGQLFLIDSKSKEHLSLSGKHVDAVTSLSFDHSGRRLMSSSLDGWIKLWDVSTGGILLAINVNTPVLSAAFFGDEHELLAASGKDGRVALWNSRTGQHIKDLTSSGSMPAYSIATGFSDKVLTFGKGTDMLSFWGLPLARWGIPSPWVSPCP